jgi:hypothetical protein
VLLGERGELFGAVGAVRKMGVQMEISKHGCPLSRGHSLDLPCRAQ